MGCYPTTIPAFIQTTLVNIVSLPLIVSTAAPGCTLIWQAELESLVGSLVYSCGRAVYMWLGRHFRRVSAEWHSPLTSLSPRGQNGEETGACCEGDIEMWWKQVFFEWCLWSRMFRKKHPLSSSRNISGHFHCWLCLFLDCKIHQQQGCTNTSCCVQNLQVFVILYPMSGQKWTRMNINIL